MLPPLWDCERTKRGRKVLAFILRVKGKGDRGLRADENYSVAYGPWLVMEQAAKKDLSVLRWDLSSAHGRGWNAGVFSSLLTH